MSDQPSTDVQYVKKLWTKFDRGDHLDIQDLYTLLIHTIAGERYLEARSESLALFKTRVDRNRLQDMIDAREALKRVQRKETRP